MHHPSMNVELESGQQNDIDPKITLYQSDLLKH